MGFFKKKNKEDFIDLTERYNKKREQNKDISKEISSEKSENMNFFGAIAQTASGDLNSSPNYNNYESSEEKRKRFAKRLRDMTEKIENLSNAIYHLQQRIELLERKAGIGGL
jgi:superfamily II RNA helicase